MSYTVAKGSGGGNRNSPYTVTSRLVTVVSGSQACTSGFLSSALPRALSVSLSPNLR